MMARLGPHRRDAPSLDLAVIRMCSERNDPELAVRLTRRAE
jgi:hypothetical protein